MNPQQQKIERFKNVVIALLFLITLIFLYTFWIGPVRPSFQFPSLIGKASESQIPSSAVLWPNQTVVDFGNGEATILDQAPPKAWELMKKTFSDFNRTTDLKINEITQDQYEKIMDFRSIIFKYSYSIPAESFCSIHDIKAGSALKSTPNLSEIGYSTGSPDSLFIADVKAQRYYRLIGKSNAAASWQALIDGIDNYQNPTYYPIGIFIGNQHQTLIPVNLSSSLSPLAYRGDFKRSMEESAAQSFFGKTLDFVRGVEDSRGTITYMYGYSQKLLTISPVGVIEYKEPPSRDSGTTEAFEKALKKAIQFIETHGGWPTSEQSSISLTLDDVQIITRDDLSGFRFFFKLMLDDNTVYYSNENPVVVELLNGQITYYRRDLIDVSILESEPDSSPQWREAETAINVLAIEQNSAAVASVLKNQGVSMKETKGEALFNEIAEKVDFVGYGYAKIPTKRYLIPAWAFRINNMTFLFELYDGHPLGYYLRETP